MINITEGKTARDNIGANEYSHIHKWLYRNFGKANHCDKCDGSNAKIFEWANISGEYRKDIIDWKQLCPSCHRKMDYTEEMKKKNSMSKIGNTNKPRVKVFQYSKDGELIKIHPSYTKAAKSVGTSTAFIWCVANGHRPTAKGFIWRKEQICK